MTSVANEESDWDSTCGDENNDSDYGDDSFTESDFTLFELCDNEMWRVALSKLTSSSSSSFSPLPATTASCIAKQAFDKKFDSSALHVTLYNRGPPQLVRSLVEVSRADRYGRNVLAILDGQKNKPLHVAAMVGCDEETITFLAKNHPEALLEKNENGRTPLTLVQRYFEPVFPTRVKFENLTKSYIRYLTQLTIHLHAHNLFVTNSSSPSPGKVKSRKRCVRALHILGFFLGRVEGVVRHVLSYSGAVPFKSPSRKRKINKLAKR